MPHQLLIVRLLALAWNVECLLHGSQTLAAEWRFAFDSAVSQGSYTKVDAQTLYNKERGYGYLETSGAISQIRSFAVDLEEGNYEVAIRFGSPDHATSNTVKAESRRLMIENVVTSPGQYVTRTFTINVRKPAISSGGTTSLNKRELGPPVSADWDEHLSFEFNGQQPGVFALEIKPAASAVTVFLAGDSTVTDQSHEPYAGWGQMLPRFFGPGVAVSNQAESGLALQSFERQKRLTKVLSMMKKGDYLFLQFGHNDQKDKSVGAGPFTSYKAGLKKFVEAARTKGGQPVLLTPMERRRWEGDVPGRTLADYAEAVRQVGVEANVPVIDLNAMSLSFYAALGPELSKKAFVHYPANTFPGQDKPLSDDTHHSSYGGYELARCVVEGIRCANLDLAKHLAPDVASLDPGHPDNPDTFSIPASPLKRVEKPAGS